MMKGSKGYIYEKALTLLRSVLWQQQLDLPVDTSEWEEIIKFATEQTLSGIIPDSLPNLPQDSIPPSYRLSAVRREMHRAMSLCMRTISPIPWQKL